MDQVVGCGGMAKRRDSENGILDIAKRGDTARNRDGEFEISKNVTSNGRIGYTRQRETGITFLKD